MTYASNGLISASDYNTLVGGNPTTTTNTLNAVWATGGAAAGYGQTAEANVAVADTVAATRRSDTRPAAPDGRETHAPGRGSAAPRRPGPE